MAVAQFCLIPTSHISFRMYFNGECENKKNLFFVFVLFAHSDSFCQHGSHMIGYTKLKDYHSLELIAYLSVQIFHLFIQSVEILAVCSNN